MVEVNLLAILGAGIASMIIGFVWYGPLFGKPWSKIMGWGDRTKEQIQEMQKKAMPGYIVSFVGSLVMAYVLAHVYTYASVYTQTFGVTGGLMAAFWSWLGFVAPVTLGAVLWESKPLNLWYINGGYYLVLLLAMGAIVGMWA